MRRLYRRWLVVLGLPLLLGVGCGSPGAVPAVPGLATEVAAPLVEPPPTPEPAPTAAPVPAPTATPVASPTVGPTATVLAQRPDEFVYIPSTAAAHQPVTVLIALHGMSGDGRAFCTALIQEAERNGWVLVAPTFRFQDWHDPAAVAADDLSSMRRLKTILDDLPQRTGLRIRQRALVYGFSRGGQVAHRFALAYPQRVAGVALLAAGTYTLPVAELTIDGQRRRLPLPYGTADLAQRLGEPVDSTALRRVAFWVAVGGNDRRDQDVPAAWTPYIGPNRLARARAFTAALDRMGVPATLAIFPGVDHREAPEMRAAAAAFLQGLPPDEALVPPSPGLSPPSRRAAAPPALPEAVGRAPSSDARPLPWRRS